MKKIVLLFMIFTLCISFCACNKNDIGEENTDITNADLTDGKPTEVVEDNSLSDTSADEYTYAFLLTEVNAEYTKDGIKQEFTLSPERYYKVKVEQTNEEAETLTIRYEDEEYGSKVLSFTQNRFNPCFIIYESTELYKVTKDTLISYNRFNQENWNEEKINAEVKNVSEQYENSDGEGTGFDILKEGTMVYCQYSDGVCNMWVIAEDGRTGWVYQAEDYEPLEFRGFIDTLYGAYQYYSDREITNDFLDECKAQYDKSGTTRVYK